MKKIGVDFDNTIIDYDRVFLTLAKQHGVIDEAFQGGKQAIREAVLRLPDGQHAWESLQGYVYGIGIADAVMFDGFDTFIRRCRAQGHSVSIVSHKTEFGHFDEGRVNLRDAALGWMRARGFFDDDCFGIVIKEIYFESTRSEKIERIATLRFTHFVDDLPEVLDDPDFPKGVTPILFTNGAPPSIGRPNAFAHWRDIAQSILP